MKFTDPRRPDLIEAELRMVPALSLKTLLEMHNTQAQMLCPCCSGEGVHVDNQSITLFGMTLQRITAHACTTCEATGIIPYLCLN